MSPTRPIQAIVDDALGLHAAWKAGRLGGAVMPEDAHPTPAEPGELAAYFTLGMCLNYQRDSYALWRACTRTFGDPERRWVFDMHAVAVANPEDLSEALARHRIALQPNRQPQIWRRVAQGFVRHAGGSVQTAFEANGFDLAAVRDFITERRAEFPYLCGPKIVNYWLYVMSSYLRWPFVNRAALSVAPDRHVISASIRLGLIEASEGGGAAVPHLIAERWANVLVHTQLTPIDMHTPLWLWGRAGFPEVAARPPP